jgi:cellulose synthase/poly-beta-1,6-N-acetylglucosamine synthase-like glycosyltransferase
MFTEILQILKLISEGIFYYLAIHFLVFIVSPLVARRTYAARYRSIGNMRRGKGFTVSVVIPEFNEKLEVFERTLRTVAENSPDEIIVVHDDGRREIGEVAARYGAKVFAFPNRVGKRRALVQGWMMAKGDIVVHVDSDEILHENAINEIVKPFEDQHVVGVQGRNLVYRTGSWLTWRVSQLIEINRDWNNRALNGCLVVVDGRFNAWRRDWLLKHVDSFLNERFLGERCEIGDDRFLTWQANLEGFKTVYQPTAIAETASPPTYKGYIKQQLRWARSGYKAFFKDITSGLTRRVPWQYNFFQLCYYMGPLSFTAAIIHDIFFAPPLVSIPIWAVIPLAIIGSGLITLIRRLAVGFKSTTLTEFLLLGATSLFVHYPMMLYALVTMKKQSYWLTRY